MKKNFRSSNRSKCRKPLSVFLLLVFLFSQSQPQLFAASPLSPSGQSPYSSVQDPQNFVPSGSGNGASSTDPTAGFLGGTPISDPQPSAEGEGEAGPATIFPLAPAAVKPITKLPKNSQGRKVPISAFVSYDPSQNDWSDITVVQPAVDKVKANFDLYNDTSYAGLVADYDDSLSAPKESVNFDTLFSGGIVLGLDNGGSSISEVIFGIQDVNGNVDWVTLAGIESSERLWNIDLANFTVADRTQVQKVFFEIDGRHVGSEINVHWGDFEYTPEVVSRPDTPLQATPLPKLSNGSAPVLQSWVSYDPDNADSALRDWSNADLSLYSEEFAQLNFNLYNDFSQAALYVDYDDLATPMAESIDFNSLFPAGLVFGLDNGGIGDVSDLYFRITDINGFDDWVKLSGISEVKKYYKLDLGLFDEADLSQIQTLEFWVTGRHTASRLNLTWGDFDYTPPVLTLKGSAYQESAITDIGAAPQVLVQGGGSPQGGAPGQISYEMTGNQEIQYQYNLWNGDQNFVSFDLQTGARGTDGTFQGAVMNLPETLVIAARGGEDGETKMVLTDIFGHEAVFFLDLDALYQNYSIPLTGAHIPSGFDRTQVSQIRFYQDRSFGHPRNWSNIVRIQIKGLGLQPEFVPSDLRVFQSKMIQDALKYFQNPNAMDPVTHLPFDRTGADGSVMQVHEIVQPTLAGFYLQMLGDFIRGKMEWPGMTKAEAMNKIDSALSGLFHIQSTFGWNGLIPWVDQGTPYPVVGIGDNANLAQSIAVMIGALEMAQLSPSERTQASNIAARAEHFLDLQAPGYAAAVDPATGLFSGAIYRSTGAGAYYIDRLLTEFRGAIAFLLVRYPQLPRSVWNNLTSQKDSDYVDRNGNRITNMQSYEGGAFQYFWPLLRNSERDFIGLRNALESYFNTQTDYAARNHIPGFLSASDMPGHAYNGLVGIPQLAETQDPLLVDLGSTYALASAYSVNQYQVLNWLKKIHDANPALYGQFGFLDSARSNSEVNGFYLGIDVASSILALNNAGPEAFENYLRNRAKEHDYNLIYDQGTQFSLERTLTQAAAPPEFPDRSYNVFSHVLVDGTLGNFPYTPTAPQGVRLAYNGFGTAFDGRYWELSDTYDAQSNLFEMYYSIQDTPGKIRIEFKDDTPQENLIYAATITLPPTAVGYQKMEIQLPNSTAFSRIKKVFLIIDQTTGDTRGDFMVHALNFKHFPSSQNLQPLSQAPAAGDTTVNESYGMELLSSSPASSLEIISPKLGRLHYDIPSSGGYAAVSLNADPDGDGQGLFDLSKKSKVVFGLSSASASRVKVEVEDTAGRRAIFYASGIDVAKHYYEFLTASLQGSIDISKVKRINFVVDQTLVNQGTLTGILDLQIL